MSHPNLDSTDAFDMTFRRYQIAALKTARDFKDPALDLTHAALGMLTEAGEYATEVKRMFAYNKPIDAQMVEHMTEELGDLMWYVALACNTLGVPMSEVALHNLQKLAKRYPGGFDALDAEARADKRA